MTSRQGGRKATILKNGARVEEVTGKIVRFNSGRSALMRVEKAETDAFGKRLYGTNIIGDHHAAYAHNCELATRLDMLVWESTQGDRNFG